MKVFNEDYKLYQADQNCLNKLPLEFIEKYNCIFYCKYEKGILLLVNSDFEYFHISKLSYFIKDEIYLSCINQNDFSSIINLIKINDDRNNAVNKFQANSTQESHELLKESTNVFYNAEIENSPIVKIVDSIIEEGITLKTSDIHFEPSEQGLKVKFRIDGKIFDKSLLPLSTLSEISTRIKVLSNLDITKKLIPQDGKLKFKFEDREFDIRVSILPGIYGERIALRILDMNKGYYSIKDLGFNKDTYENIMKLMKSSSGLILVVGPTGSGKSTTLQSFLYNNLKRNENIITVEDPVEYTIDGITQVQINEEAGLDFATCLRTILRQDPNIIMIGEIRDLETAKIACRASITGHLVYSTLHTNTSVGVINRLKDMNIEPFLLVDALRGIISQRLIRTLCPNCKKKKITNEQEMKYLELHEEKEIYHSCGCGNCNMTGYKGRRGIYEVIVLDDDFKKLISENAQPAKYWKLINKKNFQTMFENGKELILQGITTIEELQSILN
jgi:type IV pilus assembly protein PilB